MKIDIHTHILPETWPDFAAQFGYGGFLQIDHHGSGCARLSIDGKPFREIEQNCWDPKTRLEECDRTGVDVQVLSTVPVMFNYWTQPEHGAEIARFLNDDIARVVADHPRRFIGLGNVPLQSGQLAIRELERCIKALGMAGVQIGTNVNGTNLDSPDLFPFFEAAADLGAAIFVHPWDMIGHSRMTRYWLPWLVGMPAETSLAICSLIFSGVLERLPKLRIAFAHGGGAFPATIGRIAHAHEARPDLCAVDNPVNPRAYLKRIYIDTIVHEPLMLRYLLDLMGPERLALGSDYPFPLGEPHPGELIETLGVDEKTKQRLFSETALEWLAIDGGRFAS